MLTFEEHLERNKKVVFTAGDRDGAKKTATQKPWGIMTLKCSLMNSKKTSVGEMV